MKIMIIIACLLALAGCAQPDGSHALGMRGSPAWLATATPQAKFMFYNGTCESYGFTAGTIDMAYCIQRVAGAVSDNATQQMVAVSNNLAAQAQANAIANAQRQPVRLQTRCTTYYNTTSCY